MVYCFAMTWYSICYKARVVAGVLSVPYDRSSCFRFYPQKESVYACSHWRRWLPKREGTHVVGRTANGYRHRLYVGNKEKTTMLFQYVFNL